MNTPKIRFKGFKDDWEQRKLSELTTMHARIGWQNLRTSEFLDSGDYMLITGTDFQEGVIDYSTCHYVEKERYDQDKNIQIKNGSILITKDGTLGKVAYVQGLMMPATLNAGVFNVTIKNENIMDGKYLFQYLKAPFLMDYVSKKATGGTIKHLNQSILVDFPVAMPKREEQVKISRYFTALDNLITLHQRKCDETKQLKKFMLQKMFPKNGEKNPEIRFEGFTDDWEQRKLGEVCEIKDSARIPNSEWSESGVPYIRASDVTNENTDGVLFISQERYEFYKNRTGAPTKDDVLFNGGGEIGKSLLITDEKPIYVQGGAVLYAQTSKSRELVGQYLKTYFETTNAKSYIDAASAGGTMRHFTLKPSQIMRILMPSVEEQEKIGEYFANLDQLITLHQCKCDKYSNIKKGMMSDLLTGKIRLV